jgi:flavin reductase (DIM6/NTAB) family NADH-FMN oxidoreductase RutF
VSEEITAIDTSAPIWDRIFSIAPLALVGTREADEGFDLAPKHMVTPLGWQNYWCFVCTPRHATYRNVERDGVFTASFPEPEQMVAASLAAGPRSGEGTKPSLQAIETFPARKVEGVLVRGSRLWLECELDRFVDGFGESSLVIGRIVAAAAPERTLRSPDQDDADLLRDAPLTAYVSPGRFAPVGTTFSFPYHVDFRV